MKLNGWMIVTLAGVLIVPLAVCVALGKADARALIELVTGLGLLAARSPFAHADTTTTVNAAGDAALIPVTVEAPVGQTGGLTASKPGGSS